MSDISWEEDNEMSGNVWHVNLLVTTAEQSIIGLMHCQSEPSTDSQPRSLVVITAIPWLVAFKWRVRGTLQHYNTTTLQHYNTTTLQHTTLQQRTLYPPGSRLWRCPPRPSLIEISGDERLEWIVCSSLLCSVLSLTLQSLLRSGTAACCLG